MIRRWLGCSILLAVVVGCGPTGPGVSQGGAVERQAQPTAPKTLTLATLNSLEALGPWSVSGAGGALTLVGVHTNPLVTTDTTGAIDARLAAKLPSFEGGSVVLLPDGRMQTTWSLRPNLKWHDGAPFTADDVVFTWEAYRDAAIPFARGEEVRQMSSVEALDPLTVIVTYRRPYFQWVNLGIREFWLLPRHVLGDALRGDKQAFVNHPYFTTAYVHLGPYRVVDFGMGENMLLRRVDDYFLGSPKVETIIIRSIANANALLASLLAGTIDAAGESALPRAATTDLRQEWARTGEGTVLARRAQWYRLLVQYHPEWARPPELSQDVRVRRGLYLAIDRDAIREAIFPGIPGTSADSFMAERDPRGPTVGEPFARYRYDPVRSAQELADAGWRRSGDGRLRNDRGEQVQVGMRSNEQSANALAIIAQYWRDIGIDAQEEITSASLARDSEYQARFAGVVLGVYSSGTNIFLAFDSRLHPTAENRFTGTALGSYANPALDQLIDKLYGTIDQQQQGLVLKEMGEILATDLPALPMYYAPSEVAVRRGIRAMVDDYAGTGTLGMVSRNAHLWDRE